MSGESADTELVSGVCLSSLGQVVDSEGIDWHLCLKTCAKFSDLTIPVCHFDLIEIDGFQPVPLKSFKFEDEPSFYEPLPVSARPLGSDGVNRLLVRLHLFEDAVTSIFDILRLGFCQNGSIVNVFPCISEDVVVSQGLVSCDVRLQMAVNGSFLALFKGAIVHLDLCKSRHELASLGLQHPSNSSFNLCPIMVHCNTQQLEHQVIGSVNPLAFVFELRQLSNCSDGLSPVVVTVEGDVTSMFFGSEVQLAASCDELSDVFDDSSNDVLSVKLSCSWLGIKFKSRNLEPDAISNCLALSHHEFQPADDPGIALSKSEQVTPKEDFDCSDASLESEGDFNNLLELSDDFNCA